MFIAKKSSNLSRRQIAKPAVKVEVSKPVKKEAKKKESVKAEEPAPKKGKGKKALLSEETPVVAMEEVKNNEE